MDKERIYKSLLAFMGGLLAILITLMICDNNPMRKLHIQNEQVANIMWDVTCPECGKQAEVDYSIRTDNGYIICRWCNYYSEFNNVFGTFEGEE